MVKEDYKTILDWLEDFISSGQAEIELGKDWEEQDLVKYLKDHFEESSFLDNVVRIYGYDYVYWEDFYTLFFKKQKYIIENNRLIKPCLLDIKKLNHIPNMITIIEPCAFENCYDLNNIIIPKNIRIIGEYAFHDCSSLRIVTIHNTLQHIKSYAFYDERGGYLETINFKGIKEEWNKIKKDEDWFYADLVYSPHKDKYKVTIHCNDGDLEQKY